MSDYGSLVRKKDPDRYICILFAKRGLQQDLFSICAFYSEVAEVSDRVTEPQLGRIRLQWWREALMRMSANYDADDLITAELSKVYKKHRLSPDLFNVILEARSLDIDNYQPTHTLDLVNYIKNTSAALSQLFLNVMQVCDEETKLTVEEVSIAFGLVGVLRSTRYLASNKRILLPSSRMKYYGISKHQLYEYQTTPQLINLVEEIIELSLDFLERARARKNIRTRAAISCLLQAKLTELYIDKLIRNEHNIFKPEINNLSPLKPWRLFVQNICGRF